MQCGGVRLFEEGMTAAKRRTSRTARRRLARRNQRLKWLQLLFGEEVASVAIVSRNAAIKSVETGKPCNEAGWFTRVFRKTLTEVILKNGTKYYFELMKPEDFIKLLK